MASVSDEIPPTQDNDEVKSVPSSTTEDEQQQQQQEQIDQPSTSIPNEPEEISEDTQLSSTITSDIQEKKEAAAEEEVVVVETKATTLTDNVNNETNDSKSQEEVRPTEKSSRSVNFASTVEEFDTPNLGSTNSNKTSTRSTYSSSKTSRRPVDFIDTLVESYKLETSGNTSPIKEEKKYVPKTNRSRLNPNWREHRTRHLMNKLEELSLWDREEELKASQAQALREQKWEQIQDRQRNHDLCLNLMRQRHESEMESAILLDRGANIVNDENTNATIARAMNISSPANVLAYDLPTPPHTLKRRIKQEQDPEATLKTPIGRYRQFETSMDNKLDKINQKLKPDIEIMRAYSPYRTSIPATTTPLFSETYTALLSVPDTYSSNKYNQYHYGVAPHLHSASPDYEARIRSYSNRDVRVPLKEQANDYNYLDDENLDENNRSKYIDYDHYTKYRTNPVENDYYSKYRSNSIEPEYQSKYRSNPTDEELFAKYRSNPIDDEPLNKYRSTLDYSPPRRTTSMASPTASALYDLSTVANTPREFSFIHSRQPTSTSVHLRSLNDDLNAITRFSTETSKKILQNLTDPSDDHLSKSTRSSASTRKNVSFPDDDDLDGDNYTSRYYSSKTTQQPVEILSLSATR